MSKKSIHIWMQMLGFNRDDPDRGAARFLDQTGFTPDSVCALLFHCDFINLHRGMEEEYVLFPDNCAYHGIPFNKERARQPWTNHDLRSLVAELKKKGVDFYAGIMGSYLNDTHHHEWLTDHRELQACRRDKDGSLMCLKRFKDGTYYEDFFAEKLVETLVDYGMAGVHIADAFCPSARLYQSDYSWDMVEQFQMHTGMALPQALTATAGKDDMENRTLRADYIWANLREEWIRFYEWRWAKFFKTVCDAAHKAGKKVWILGMYCTDPFETRYIHGFDTAKVMEAGVDCMTANILPTSVGLNARQEFFHRYHLDLPLVRAQALHGEIISMVNVQDASEEWSVLEHQPVKLERDIYTITAARNGAKGDKASAAGLFLCLGDGLKRNGWDWMKERIDVGFAAETAGCWSPMILWSQTASDRLIGEYIKTRRTSDHKQATELFKAGLPFGGAVNSAELKDFEGCLFVPNYDLLAEEEQELLKKANYPWVGTAPAAYGLSGLNPTCETVDAGSDYPMKAFLCNAECTADLPECFGTGVSRGEEPDRDINSLEEELPFRSLSEGFIANCVTLLKAARYAIFQVECDRPMLALKLKNGKDRLYIYNPKDNVYDYAFVTYPDNVKSVNRAGFYPVLPVRFLQSANHHLTFNYNNQIPETQKFQTKLAPAGVSILEIER